MLASDVHAAYERDHAVDDLQLAVVSQVHEKAQALGIQATEPGKIPAGLLVSRQQVLRKAVRAHAIEQQAHDDAAPGGLGQKLQESRARLVALPDIKLKVDMVDRLPDPPLERGIKFPRVAQDAKAFREADGKLVDAGQQLQELAVPARQLLQEKGGGVIRGAGRNPLTRGPRGKKIPPLEPLVLQPVGADREIDERAQQRDEDDGP